jgi:hypothetical protein
MQRKLMIILAALLVSSMLLAACQSQSAGTAQQTPAQQTITVTSYGATPSPSPSEFHPETVLGISGDANQFITYAGIPWVRQGYPTCGTSILSGQVLKDTITRYHSLGVHVMLTYCQTGGDSLFDMNRLNDAAQGGADAVQCGNEQAKQSTATLYVTPDRFARFFDLCQSAMHAVRPDIPIILGAMDPLVFPDDEAKLMNQVHYLDAMQSAMNSTVHPGGNWDWHAQILGLIDSWHNGYPSVYTNNLLGLYTFWAQQLHVDINSNALGKHLWVVEGTGCVNGCGIDASNARQVAISHIMTLITDAQTTRKYHVPFFYFPEKDFFAPQSGWIYGVLDKYGRPKPLRQDLPMGARTLEMSCSSGKIVVADQEQLLAKLYSGCTLPGNYLSTLES